MKKILLLFTVLIFSFNAAGAAIRVTPGYVEIDANKTKKDYASGSFTVSGGKDENIRFKVYPVFFEYDKKGSFVELADSGQKNSLMDKIKFYPTEFTCRNGLDQKVRFTITGIKSLPSGESRLVLFLEDTNTKEVVIKNANGKIGGKLVLKTRVGVPIYVDKGVYAKKGTLDTVAFKKTGEDYIVDYKVSSTGNSKIRYTGFCYISQNNNLIDRYEIYGSTVGGGTSLERVQKIDIPKDKIKEGEDYKIKFVLNYRDEKDNEKTLKKELIYTPQKAISSPI